MTREYLIDMLNTAYNEAVKGDTYEFALSLSHIQNEINGVDVQYPFICGIFIGEILGLMKAGDYQGAMNDFRYELCEGDMAENFSGFEGFIDEVIKKDE